MPPVKRRSIPRLSIAIKIAFLGIALTMTSHANGEVRDDHLSPRAHLPSFEEWSAETMPQAQLCLGTIVEYGLTEAIQIGVDPLATSVGVRTLHAKWKLPFSDDDKYAIGLRWSWLDRNFLTNNSIKNHFSELDGHFLRPSVAWTTGFTEKLKIHTMWATGIGSIRAELSDQGRRSLWASKNSPTPYPETQTISRNSGAMVQNEDRRQNNESTYARQTMQIQSMAGMTEDRFQVTGDWVQNDGSRRLLTTRLERTKLESLEAFTVRLTLAHEWGLDQFHVRLGGGPMYAIFTGQDLDGADIHSAVWMPIGDLAMFWIF